MKFLLFLSMIILLINCSDSVPMSNEEIIAECAKCREAGLTVEVHRRFIDTAIVKIQCGTEELRRHNDSAN